MTVAPSNSPNFRVIRLLFSRQVAKHAKKIQHGKGKTNHPKTPPSSLRLRASARCSLLLPSALRLGAFARGNVSRQGFSEDLAQRRGGAGKIKRGGRPPFYRDGRRRLRCLDYARHDRRPEQLTQFPGYPPFVFSPSRQARQEDSAWEGEDQPPKNSSLFPAPPRLCAMLSSSPLRFAAWRLCERKCFSPRIFGGLAQRRRED